MKIFGYAFFSILSLCTTSQLQPMLREIFNGRDMSEEEFRRIATPAQIAAVEPQIAQVKEMNQPKQVQIRRREEFLKAHQARQEAERIKRRQQLEKEQKDLELEEMVQKQESIFTDEVRQNSVGQKQEMLAQKALLKRQLLQAHRQHTSAKQNNKNIGQPDKNIKKIFPGKNQTRNKSGK